MSNCCRGNLCHRIQVKKRWCRGGRSGGRSLGPGVKWQKLLVSDTVQRYVHDIACFPDTELSLKTSTSHSNTCIQCSLRNLLLHLNLLIIASCDPTKLHSEMSLFSVALSGRQLWATGAACALFYCTFSVYGCIHLLETNGVNSLHSKHEVVKDLPMVKKRDTENMSKLLDVMPNATPKVSPSLPSSSEIIGSR